MNSGNTTIVIGDAHLHWYPQYDPRRVFDSLTGNLARIVNSLKTDAPFNVIRTAFVMERQGQSCFAELRRGTPAFASAGLTVIPGEDKAGLALMRGEERVELIAGKQIATRERIEVLGIGLTEDIPDGCSAKEAIERILQAGGIPLLPWAVGKWFFKRGALVRELLSSYRPNQLLIGDTSLRPVGWPAPRLIREARSAGFGVVAGSDPLPLPDEELRMGEYAFVYRGPFDANRVVSSVRRLLIDHAGDLQIAGRRNSIGQVWVRLRALQRGTPLRAIQY